MLKRIIFALPLLLIYACSESCEDELTLTNDIIISTDEKTIMDFCDENQLASLDLVKDNLIGTWENVGYACGFCVPHDAPLIQIRFDQDSIYIEESTSVDLVTSEVYEYRIVETDEGFRLQTSPFSHYLLMDSFSECFMYFDNTFQDVLMVTYRKQ